MTEHVTVALQNLSPFRVETETLISVPPIQEILVTLKLDADPGGEYPKQEPNLQEVLPIQMINTIPVTRIGSGASVSFIAQTPAVVGVVSTYVGAFESQIPGPGRRMANTSRPPKDTAIAVHQDLRTTRFAILQIDRDACMGL